MDAVEFADLACLVTGTGRGRDGALELAVFFAVAQKRGPEVPGSGGLPSAVHEYECRQGGAGNSLRLR